MNAGRSLDLFLKHFNHQEREFHFHPACYINKKKMKGLGLMTWFGCHHNPVPFSNLQLVYPLFNLVCLDHNFFCRKWMTRLEKLTCLSLLKYTDFLRLRPCQRHSCVGVPSRISVNKKVVYIGVCLLRKDFFNKKEVYEFTFSPSLSLIFCST